MAKELPYFKFNASEWISGEITLEDLVTQGAFINICAYYWFKSGCITLTEIKRRLKLKQPTIDSLVTGGHIKVDGDAIEITFLREQFDERGHISKRNSENGKKGGAPKGNSNAKNEEKNNREQPKTSNIEREEEENKNRKEKEESSADLSATLEQRSLDFRNKVAEHLNEYPKEMLRAFYDYWSESNEGGRKMKWEMQKTFNLPLRLATWKRNESKFNTNGKPTKQNHINSLRESFANRVMQADSGEAI
jgi:hypothetical protein